MLRQNIEEKKSIQGKQVSYQITSVPAIVDELTIADMKKLALI